MNIIFFIISLSVISLVVLALLQILDFANIVPRQKIAFIKVSLMTLLLAPVIINLFNLTFLKELVIIIPPQLTDIKLTQILPMMPSENEMSYSFYIILVYGIGVCMMLCRIVCSYFGAKKQLQLSKKIFIQGLPVFLNSNIKTPISFGFPKAKIYFPSDSELKWTKREIQISLAHEKIHVEQNDSLWKLLSLIVQAFLFFSPWIYYLHKRFELEMEILCDLNTCKDTDADIQEYGNLLLAMTCKQSKNFIFNNITDSTLIRRFSAMKKKKRSARFFISVLSVAIFLIGSTAIGMASSIPEDNSVFKITSKIIIDGKIVAKPVIISKSNQKALIVLTNTNNAGSEGLRVELIARNNTKFQSKNTVQLDYDIQYKDGQETFYSKPQIIVLPNQEGKIKLSSSGRSYELDVIVEREK